VPERLAQLLAGESLEVGAWYGDYPLATRLSGPFWPWAHIRMPLPRCSNGKW
jgi:hypothetical protein